MYDALPDRVRIGAFEVDLRAGELREGERSVCLQEQPLFVLRMLVVRPGEIVTREEIKQKLWPNDTVVDFDQGVNAAVRKLRIAFGDSADEPKYLGTIARRGYRLLAPVEPLGESDSPNAPAHDGSDSGPPQPDESGIVGKKVSHYRVLKIIGGGGMGLVYEAEDLKLERRVALKFLPDELASDPIALQRFEREAKSASSLNHPNVCTIYEIEEHELQPFIVMELLHGDTLRERLRGLSQTASSMPLVELINIATQVCDGLQAAHEQGIVHRDIKPPNIFITTSGQVKILDFGLAKLTASGSDQSAIMPRLATELPSQPALPGPQDDTLTLRGEAIGTVGYMSPEQILGEPLDARTDLFSLGLVVYEMATGQRAFTGENAFAVEHAILTHAPNGAQERKISIPPRLEAVINRAIEKERGRRYRSAAAMSADIRAIMSRRKTDVSAAMLSGWKWLTAVTLCVLAVVGIFYWRAHSQPQLSDADTVVLAEFANKTGDSAFDDSLKLALNVELMQSPYVHLLSPDKVRAALKQMKQLPAVPFTPELAREVCLRTNSKAFIAGSLTDEGNQYRLELRATDCHTGKTLAESRQDIPGRGEVIRSLGSAGEDLRGQLGEPYAVLQKFSKPLDEATSASPEALQAVFEAIRAKQQHGDVPDVFSKLKRAIELDPFFAQAYLFLGISYLNAKEVELSKDSLQRAYELRQRLMERARLQLEAFYYIQITGEAERSLVALKQWAEEYSTESLPHADLAEDLIANGQYEAAIQQARESVRLVPNGAGYVNLVAADIAFDQLSQAKADFDEAIQLGQTDGYLYEKRYTLAFLQNDPVAMQEQLAWAKGNPAFEYRLLSGEADTNAYYGRIAKSQAVAVQAVDSAGKAGQAQGAVGLILWDALRSAETGDTAGARQKVGQALASNADRDIQAMAALVLARAGDVNKAEALAGDLNRQHPLDSWLNLHELPAIRAAIELQKNNPGGALDQLHTPPEFDLADLDFRAFPPVYPIYLRGEAYLKAGQGQLAAAEFQKIVDHPGIVTNFITGALARLGVARANQLQVKHAAGADSDIARSRARAAYKDFLTLWKDADPDVPIYQQAKAEYAKLQ